MVGKKIQGCAGSNRILDPSDLDENSGAWLVMSLGEDLERSMRMMRKTCQKWQDSSFMMFHAVSFDWIAHIRSKSDRAPMTERNKLSHRFPDATWNELKVCLVV